MPLMLDPTRRFSSRVGHYLKGRPGYPPELLDILRDHAGLTASSVIADVGSGTGLLTGLLLTHGNVVFAVEPNADMRRAADARLQSRAGFRSVDGRAEATGLPAASVDLVTVGTAFHWFDRGRTRDEFSRILVPGGRVVLAWNDRDLEASPFMRGYEQLLQQFAIDYPRVHHRQLDVASMAAFYAPAPVETHVLPFTQAFDLDTLQARLLSSSYAPEPGHPRHEPMLGALRTLFDAHAAGGEVAFHYRTEIYIGRLGVR
jgi:SAM-dependent methyltransferase